MKTIPKLAVPLIFALGVAATVVAPASAQEEIAYDQSSEGTRWFVGGNGFSIKMLVEASNLGGGEVELGEITFPVGSGAQGGRRRRGTRGRG